MSNPDPAVPVVNTIGIVAVVLLVASLVLGLSGLSGWSTGTGVAGGLLLLVWAVASPKKRRRSR